MTEEIRPHFYTAEEFVEKRGRRPCLVFDDGDPQAITVYYITAGADRLRVLTMPHAAWCELVEQWTIRKWQGEEDDPDGTKTVSGEVRAAPREAPGELPGG